MRKIVLLFFFFGFMCGTIGAEKKIIIVPFDAEKVEVSRARSIVFQDNMLQLMGADIDFSSPVDNVYKIDFTQESSNVKVNDVKENICFLTPNPAENLVDLHQLTKGDKVELFSSNGMLVHTFIAEEEKQTLNVSALPTGIYFFKIGGKEVVKLIKK